MEKDYFKLIPEPYKEDIKDIIDRCEDSSINYSFIPDDVEEPHDCDLVLSIPRGRNKQDIRIQDAEDSELIRSIKFENYTFLERYEGICCYKDGTIEAIVRPIRNIPSRIVMRRLMNLNNKEFNKLNSKDSILALQGKTSDKDTIRVSIGAPTKEMLILGQSTFFGFEDEPDDLTIKITGVKIENNKDATTTLEKISNSLLFQINQVRRFPMMLTVHREPLRVFLGTGSSALDKTKMITFPKHEYDTEPMNLFWHAQSARQMPLLQFLAYYQVLEHYFPFYTNKEVQAEVKNILKEPDFDPDNARDMNRVIKSISSRTRKGYGEEKAQLSAAIRGCTQDEDIRDVLKRDHILEYFKEEYKQLSTYKVTGNNKDIPLANQLSDRIYDIRCKIVHTKAEDVETEKILPFTRQEILLQVENEIMEFLASKTLIAGSKKLSI
ncbi:hypothetical protein ACFLUH_03390 [Chloroflexota bacterium]